MENSSTIHVFITGGTIDSHWEGKLDTSTVNKESYLSEYFKGLILYLEIETTVVCMKDSRDLNRGDLNNLLQQVEKSPHKKIVITHGTYTMQDTAKFLKYGIKRKDQVIILTGSMVPLLGITPSDAPFNLGYAIAKAEDLLPGVYVAMNGRVFDPDEVAKNLAEGKFYSVFEKKQ